MNESQFKSDAKSIVDMAFNNKLFKDELTRDDFNAFEDYIGFLLQTRFESYTKMKSLIDKIEERTNKLTQ